MVRIHLGPGFYLRTHGPVAQLGEHLLCKQGVSGSIPLRSINCCVIKNSTLIQLFNSRFHIHIRESMSNNDVGLIILFFDKL